MNENLKKGDIVLAPLFIQTGSIISSGLRLCCIMNGAAGLASHQAYRSDLICLSPPNGWRS